MFQKLPVFTLGYLAISIMAHLYYTNVALLVKVEELGELKKVNSRLYNKLSKYNKHLFLKVKLPHCC